MEIEVVELTQQNTLQLPPQIAAKFHPTDRFAVWVDGDTLHLKRITPSAVLDVVAEAPAGDPLSLEEINAIVHTVRRQRQVG